MSNQEVHGGFCIECGHHVDSFEGLTACPECGTRALPCSDADQVTILINWHELHLLVVWAENWQRAQGLGRTVYSIAQRIAAQYPERAKRVPLTLAEDLGAVMREFGDLKVSNPDLRRDIAEQTGEEPGLLREETQGDG